MDMASHIPVGLFRPPANRAMRVLDRSCFQKSIPTSAARVLDSRNISKLRSELGHDVLKLDRMQSVKSVRDPQGEESKALLLDPKIKPDDASTWSPILSELVKSAQVDVMPYELKINYDYWNYHDIMGSIFPQEEHEEYPTGFTIVGHVAHLNLRDEHIPYKNLIAEVLLDKNPMIRTVINKIDEVGEKNEFRTFNYELLAGEPDMEVEVHEGGCAFRFDYSKVYWNSRLETEHRRLVQKFLPGEAVCDVMAGIGPFAVPAGKKNIFVWANDLNPDSYARLTEAIQFNKVSGFVKPFNEDGHIFIRDSAKKLLKSHIETFNHYVLNLPASAITFLPTFVGLYNGHTELFTPHTYTKLPMLHVYCFNTKSDDNKQEEKKICREISEQIGYEMKPGNPEIEGEVAIWDVRDVAPLKRMFCASFRLPEEVGFRANKNQNRG